MKALIANDEAEFHWGLTGSKPGIGWFELIDYETDESMEGEIFYGISGENRKATRYDPAEFAEGEIVEVTIKAFGRTYDVTADAIELIDDGEFQEAAMEAATEAYADYEADRGDFLYDQMRDEGF